MGSIPIGSTTRPSSLRVPASPVPGSSVRTAPLYSSDIPWMHENLTLPGRPARTPTSPADAVIETVPNPPPGTAYPVRLTCPEFASLCPVAGQPDFARLALDYVPRERPVESKSLKPCPGSFRDHASFHGARTIGIARRPGQALRPAWLRVGGYRDPRGGTPINVLDRSGEPPAGQRLPDQGVAPYRGRG